MAKRSKFANSLINRINDLESEVNKLNASTKEIRDPKVKQI